MKKFYYNVTGFPNFWGKITGSYSSGTGRTPQLGQSMIGIGTPQYLYLDTSQS